MSTAVVEPDLPRAPDDLRSRTASGMGWSAGTRLLAQVLQLATAVVLARALSPEDYGTYSLAFVFVSLAAVLSQGALDAPVVYLSPLTEADRSTLLCLNAVLASLLAATLAASAETLAAVLHQPGLAAVLQLGSLVFLLSLGTVHGALLEREMRFRTVGLIDLTAVLAGAGASIGSALLLETGPLALVHGALVTAGTRSVLVVRASGWVPRARPDLACLRRAWDYSGPLLRFNVVNHAGRNGDNLLVGWALGTSVLGSYNRAYSVMLLPVQIVTQTLSRVLFPAFTALRDQPERLASAYVLSLRYAFCLASPVGVGLAAAAPACMALLYGSQWREAGTLLALLALSTPAQTAIGLAGALLKARGETRTLLRLGCLCTALTLLAVGAALPSGAEAVALAYTLQCYAGAAAVSAVTARRLGLTGRALLRPLVPAVVANAVMGGAVLAVGALLTASWPTGSLLAAQVLTGAAVYVLTLRLVDADVCRGAVGLLRGRGRLLQGATA